MRPARTPPRAGSVPSIRRPRGRTVRSPTRASPPDANGRADANADPPVRKPAPSGGRSLLLQSDQLVEQVEEIVSFVGRWQELAFPVGDASDVVEPAIPVPAVGVAEDLRRGRDDR